MNILIDIHHHDLFRSLNILFFNRLGYQIYIPYGMDWNIQFKYANYPSIDARHQYLTYVKHWLNVGDDLSNVKLLTLDEYKDIDIDIHLSSITENTVAFLESSKQYNKKTKHIFQAGNNFDRSILDGIVNNLLSSSTILYQLSKCKNKCFYHQEFNLTYFKPYNPCPNINSVYSIQHYFGTGMHPYTLDHALFLKLKSELPSFDFAFYGYGNERGPISNTPKLMSDFYKNTGFIFHVKPQGDGYGHIYHNSYACGKPVIYKSEYLKSYSVEMTPMMLFDESTSIDLSTLSINDVIDKIQLFSNDYTNVSNKVYNKFKQIVDFDKEFYDIQKFISNLI